MRLFHLVFVAYSVTILTKDIYARKGKACKNGNKRTLSWRLKLLRKVSKQLNPRIKLLSLKGRINSDLEKDKAHGWIKESESKQRHVPRIGKVYLFTNLNLNLTVLSPARLINQFVMLSKIFNKIFTVII